jgi:hypothetical protein
MKINQIGNRYILDCEYEERKYPKEAGFKWDSEIKKWWTDDLEKCKKLDCKISLINNMDYK